MITERKENKSQPYPSFPYLMAFPFHLHLIFLTQTYNCFILKNKTEVSKNRAMDYNKHAVIAQIKINFYLG